MADPKMAEAAGGEKKTLVEDGTEFKGSLLSKCAVVVSGKIDGEVDAPSLTVRASGAVYGKVRVGKIVSEGEVAGELMAENVQLSGRVNNNTIIRTKSLEVKPAKDKNKPRVTFGDCILEVGDEPVKTGGKAPAAGQQPRPQPQPQPQGQPQPQPQPQGGEKPKG